MSNTYKPRKHARPAVLDLFVGLAHAPRLSAWDRRNGEAANKSAHTNLIESEAVCCGKKLKIIPPGGLFPLRGWCGRLAEASKVASTRLKAFSLDYVTD